MSTKVVTPQTDPGADPVTGIDPWPSLADAQNNQAISSQNICARLNSNLKIGFDNVWQGFVTSVNAGKAAGAGNPGCHPPVPPKSWVVSSPDANGFQWPVQTGPPIADMTSPQYAIPPDHSLSSAQIAQNIGPNSPDIGHWMSGNWYSDGANNTFNAQSTPNGQTPPIILQAGMGGPADNGQPHVFQFFGDATTFEPGQGVQEGWFLLIS